MNARPRHRSITTAAFATLLVLAGFASGSAAAGPSAQPAGQWPPAPTPPTPPPPPSEKKAEVIDPDLLLQIGVTGGRVRGSEFIDHSEKVRGRIVGNPKHSSLGPSEGIRFDGEHDWLVATDDLAVSRNGLPQREFTVSAWVSLAATAEAGSIIGCVQDNGPAERGWTLGYSTDAFYFAIATTGADDGDGRMTYLKGQGTITPGAWYHVVGTYDGRRMRLFVNGEPVGESTEQSGDLLYPAHAPYTIACYKDDDESHPMNGSLVEVKVLGRALTPAQVTEEFTPGARLVNYRPTMEATQRFVVKPYLQFATADAVTIVWESSRPGLGVVEYGESLPYTSRSGPSEPATLHEVRLTGLKAQSNYFYRVRTIGDDGNEIVSDDLSFQTAVVSTTPFAFVVIGDTQKNKSVIEALQSFSFSLRPNFQIHVGDVVDNGADKQEWTEELLPASWPLMSRVCMYPAIGNHEDNHSNYYDYFSLPAPECWYTFTQGNAQFFSIDTNKSIAPGTEQYEWLDHQLARSTAIWKFVYHHHPVYSSDENDYGDTYKQQSALGDQRLRSLATLLERHRVDIDFNGHIHSYERSWPIFEGRVDEARGVRYITSGGGGGGLESAGPQRTWFAQRVFRGHHVTYLMIHDKTLELQAFDLEGRLFDTCTIRKP